MLSFVLNSEVDVENPGRTEQISELIGANLE